MEMRVGGGQPLALGRRHEVGIGGDEGQTRQPGNP